MDRTSKLRGGDVAKRIKVGAGLFLLVIATQLAASIALAQPRHESALCGPSASRLTVQATADCHVS